MNLQKVKILLFCFSVIMILVTSIFYVDYQDFSFTNNRSNYIVLIGLFFSAVAALIAYKQSE